MYRIECGLPVMSYLAILNYFGPVSHENTFSLLKNPLLLVRSEDCYCSLFCAKLYGKNWVRLTLSRFWAKFLYYTGHKKTVWSQKLSEIKVYCHVARGSFHPYISKRRSEWPMECEESWVRPMRTQDGDLSRRMNCLDYHLWCVEDALEELTTTIYK